MASKKISESLNQHNTDKIDGGEQSSTVRRSPRISEQVMRAENQNLEKLVSSKSGGSPPSSSQKGKQTQIASDNIEVSSTANPTKQIPMQQMCQDSNASEFDTAEKLHSCVILDLLYCLLVMSKSLWEQILWTTFNLITHLQKNWNQVILKLLQ
jgi:hypothetical protein